MMSNKIQAGVTLSQQKPDTKNVVELQKAQRLEQNTELTPLTKEETPELLIEQDNIEQPIEEKSKRGMRIWFWLFIGVLGLSVAELVLFTQALLLRQDWLAGIWLVLLAVVLILAIKQLWAEWRGLRRIKQQQADQQTAEQIYQSPAIGQAKSFCHKVAAGLPSSTNTLVQQWQQQLTEHHNDKETLELFERIVLKEVDNQALKLVSGHASASAAMIAVSPFALLDMLIVLWRNLRMLNQVSNLYGIKLSYWGRISLIRSLFKTLLYAGASEIVMDAGNHALGVGMAGKLSSRVAQGLGAGVLTARIGVKTIQASRPLPFLALEKPGVGKISGQLISDLKKLIS